MNRQYPVFTSVCLMDGMDGAPSSIVIIIASLRKAFSRHHTSLVLTTTHSSFHCSFLIQIPDIMSALGGHITGDLSIEELRRKRLRKLSGIVAEDQYEEPAAAPLAAPKPKETSTSTNNFSKKSAAIMSVEVIDWL
jgi:hypothetical protein